MAVGRAELDESAAIIADEFGTPDGQYTPIAGGDPVTVTPVMTYGSQILDDFGGYELQDLAEIKMSEIDGHPEQGDLLLVDDDVYSVDTWAPVGSMWHIVLRS